MNMKTLFVLLIFAGLYSALWMSGDAGEEWAQETAEELCKDSEVAAVYICLGNTVDVVWKDESKGSTFYEPEGNIVNCPPVAPTDMGAECMQLMMPNYCTLDDNVCGHMAPEEFPGGETEGEIIYNGVPEEEPEPVEPTPVEETPRTTDTGKTVLVEQGTGAAQAAPTAEGTLDNLILIIFALAIIAIIVLYFVFKRTTGR